MEFARFAEAHGLILDRIEVGKWVRVPTTDHPRKRNGAYKLMDGIAWVQNHASMLEPVVWKPEGPAPAIDHAAVKRRAAETAREIAERQKKAAAKAGWIMHQTKPDLHPYLAAKGFSEATGNVWDTGESRLLVVPMRIGHALAGCQMINGDGDKKFLAGQRTNDACYTIDNKGPIYLCEGYATGLSIRAALAALRARYTIIVCFSAHGISRIAKSHQRAVIVADNDASGTGERVARETGHPYWISDIVGNDFNDDHRRLGLFAVSQSLRAFLSKNDI